MNLLLKKGMARHNGGHCEFFDVIKIPSICSRRCLAARLYIINSIILQYGWPLLSYLPEKGEETKRYTRDNEMYALKR